MVSVSQYRNTEKEGITVDKKKLLKKKPRLPLEAVKKLHRHPVESKKGKKGYSRKRRRQKEENLMEYDLKE
jgi:hypothetical protein